MNELQERKYIEDDEIDLMEIIKILIDNKITIIVTTLVFTLIVILGGYLQMNLIIFLINIVKKD